MDEDDKFNTNAVLQAKVEQDKKVKEKEKELREEFGIDDDDRTIGVRVYQDNALVGLWKIAGTVLRFIINIIIFIFAAIGIVALLHPSSRAVMLTIVNETIEQFQAFLPFL